MTDAPDLTPNEAADMLAAEYVLGVLDLPERMAAERRLKSDPDFGAMVAAWESHMSGLNADFVEAAAPMNLLEGVEARLFPVMAKPRRSWQMWIGGAVVAGVVALAVAVNLLQPGPQGQILAELASQDQGLVYEATYVDGTLEIARIAGTQPASGKDHELWLIAPGSAPVSLGLLGETTLKVRTQRPPVGYVLAVSVEPKGGSTTGAPTGPVILMAEIKA